MAAAAAGPPEPGARLKTVNTLRRFLSSRSAAGLVLAGAGCGSASPSAATVALRQAGRLVRRRPPTAPPLTEGARRRPARPPTIGVRRHRRRSTGRSSSGSSRRSTTTSSSRPRRGAAGLVGRREEDRRPPPGCRMAHRRHLRRARSPTSSSAAASRSTPPTPDDGEGAAADAVRQRRSGQRLPQVVPGAARRAQRPGRGVAGRPVGRRPLRESLRKYYEDHKGDFSQNCVSHILVRTKAEADAVTRPAQGRGGLRRGGQGGLARQGQRRQGRRPRLQPQGRRSSPSSTRRPACCRSGSRPTRSRRSSASTSSW